jgi:acrylyl-CoA reductase (NADPH)
VGVGSSLEFAIACGKARITSPSSETHYGGYAQRVRVKGDWRVEIPEAWTRAEAMAVGTAGYTAALCIPAIEAAGVTPAR